MTACPTTQALDAFAAAVLPHFPTQEDRRRSAQAHSLPHWLGAFSGTYIPDLQQHTTQMWALVHKPIHSAHDALSRQQPTAATKAAWKALCDHLFQAVPDLATHHISLSATVSVPAKTDHTSTTLAWRFLIDSECLTHNQTTPFFADCARLIHQLSRLDTLDAPRLHACFGAITRHPSL